MSTYLSIPLLSQSVCQHEPSEEWIQNNQVDVDAFFNQYGPFDSEGTVDPLNKILGKSIQPSKEWYEVEDSPETEDGVLSLKMPIEITQPETPTLKSEKRRHNESSKRINPIPHIGVSVHMGYIPLKVDDAFANPVSIDALSDSNFTIPRGKISVDKIINRIRAVVFSNDEINEIVPKTKYYSPDKFCGLYSSTLIYTTFDDYCNHRFAQMHILLVASEKDTFAVTVFHHHGDSRLSMSFFLTVRAYMESNGKTDSNVPPTNFHDGFEDQHCDSMVPRRSW